MAKLAKYAQIGWPRTKIDKAEKVEPGIKLKEIQN